MQITSSGDQVYAFGGDKGIFHPITYVHVICTIKLRYVDIFITIKEAPYSLYVTYYIRTLKICYHFFENMESCLMNIESDYITEQKQFYFMSKLFFHQHIFRVQWNTDTHVYTVMIKILNSFNLLLFSKMKDMLFKTNL